MGEAIPKLHITKGVLYGFSKEFSLMHLMQLSVEADVMF